MNGCRISKVKFKSGGEMTIFRTKKQNDAQMLFSEASVRSEGESVLAAGYFLITEYKSYTGTTGDIYPTIAGGCDLLKQKLMDQWRDGV